ncbi:MAG: DEAD/DEAH box helicase family protein, partial [Planctomycetaceae bacterium]|nr:DEAD/DEAH box helicase family protein [Planctomycetaceae bacterium]
MPRQPGLFPDDVPDESPLETPWVHDALKDHSIATVVFAEVPWGPFDYLIPSELQDSVKAGRRVQVPLGRGNRQVSGYCVAVKHTGTSQQDTTTPHKKERSYKLKPITSVIDGFTLLSAEMLELTKWMADYYIARHGQVLEAAVPAGVRSAAGTRKVRFFKLNKSRLEMIQSDELPPKQQRIVELLRGNDAWQTADQICKRVHCSQAPIQALVKKGIVQTEHKRVQKTDVQQEILPREENLQLNPAQQQALQTITAAIKNDSYETVLVHGVTGSGKTEVYIQAIEEVISYGRQAIVLVPEISLTPQTRQRFRSRFDKVAVLHSHLSDAERHWHWQQIAQGEVQVIVGARSAIFAPAPRLGLIVLDEEHETTFKQETVPRYHARDVAAKRAQLQNIPLV